MEEFFNNVSRYPRYMITFTLGILFTAISPLMPLLKRPSTAIPTVAAMIAFLTFLSFTLRAMLGLNVV